MSTRGVKLAEVELAEVIARVRAGSSLRVEAERAGYSDQSGLRSRLKRAMGLVAYADLLRSTRARRSRLAAIPEIGVTTPAAEATSDDHTTAPAA